MSSNLTRIGFNKPQALDVSPKGQIDDKTSSQKVSGPFSATLLPSSKKKIVQIHQSAATDSPLLYVSTQKDAEEGNHDYFVINSVILSNVSFLRISTRIFCNKKE